MCLSATRPGVPSGRRSRVLFQLVIPAKGPLASLRQRQQEVGLAHGFDDIPGALRVGREIHGIAGGYLEHRSILVVELAESLYEMSEFGVLDGALPFAGRAFPYAGIRTLAPIPGADHRDWSTLRLIRL